MYNSIHNIIQPCAFILRATMNTTMARETMRMETYI